MAWRMSGSYVGACDCNLVCPCPYDGPPTGRDGQCHGSTVFAIREGNLDGVDLSGVNWVLYNQFPSNLTSGNWRAGLVVDEGASDEQAQAVERIVSGQEGGPFADFAPLIGEYLGMERARVTHSDGSGEVGGRTQIRFEPFTGPDGAPTTVRSAMFGFAPEFKIGRASGRSESFGLTFDARYGESADFEYSSEMAGDVHPRA